MILSTKNPKSGQLVGVGLVLMAILALAMVIVTAKPARAQTPLQVYLGGSVGYSLADTTVSSPLLPGASLDGLGSKGAIGGIVGGVDMTFPSSIWFAGVFGSYTWQKVDFSINPLATATLGDSWRAGVRTGFASGKSKYYASLALTQTESRLFYRATYCRDERSKPSQKCPS